MVDFFFLSRMFTSFGGTCEMTEALQTPNPPSLHLPLALLFIAAKRLTAVDDPGTVTYIRRPD